MNNHSASSSTVGSNGTPSTSASPAFDSGGFVDRNRLAPEDAFYAHSPPRRAWDRSTITNGANGAGADGVLRRPRREKEHRSRSRKRTGVWKKLMWVRQSYPDNYTDPPTFLSHLQVNPRLQQYDFWPLVADSMVIVQHVCSVAIFVCCFVGIYQEQVSPLSVVGWASAGTVLGYVFWDIWIGQEQAERTQQGSSSATASTPYHSPDEVAGEDSMSVGSGVSSSLSQPAPHGLGLTMLSQTNRNQSTTSMASSQTHSQTNSQSVSQNPSTNHSRAPSRPPSQGHSRNHSRNRSSASLHTLSSFTSPTHPYPPPFADYGPYPPYNAPASSLSPRNQQRLATAKSALLIYGALLGLSPILKSLTKSTTSDSIWAITTSLMLINVFFFDYGGEVGAKFPASLSTNAALMASTVLASRLTSTTHVFSLTLFSIEVFGLFPVFRRHLRHRSWHLHVLLTVLLIVGAGAGLGITLVGGGRWTAGIIGAVVWGLGNVLAMGGCSWWLIGLQRYKNVVIGPWDPARPVIRAGGWE